MNNKIDLNLIIPLELKKNHTIFHAMNLIEGKQWMIVSIIDDDGKLVGIASPGNLRKALLTGQPVNTPLGNVMNTNPATIRESELSDRKKMAQILADLKVKYGQLAYLYSMLPVVREDGTIKGLISLEELTIHVDEKKQQTDGRTVLIVGGAGYIGSVTSRLLLEQGWRVKVLDKLIYFNESMRDINSARYEFIEGDAANIDDIVKAVDEVDAVVYLAELVGDPACAEAPQAALKTNYLAVTSMAHLCSHLHINRFVYMSSCSVYGASENPDVYLTEESGLNPVSLYARIKSMVEGSILSVCNMPNPLFAPTILRLATVFGPSYRPRFDLVVNIFAKNAFLDKRIEVFGGDQWRPNVHVRDVARAIQHVLDAPIEKVRGEVFNVGGDAQNHTINELADLTKKVFVDVEICKNTGVVDKRNYRVSFEKIEKALGYKAQYSVLDALREFKELLESDQIKDLDSPRYNNVKTLQELKYA